MSYLNYGNYQDYLHNIDKDFKIQQKGLTKMKVIVNSNSKSTISNSDIHSNLKSLTEMIKNTSQNIKSPIKINKEDDYKKTFNRSISKTIKERQRYYID